MGHAWEAYSSSSAAVGREGAWARREEVRRASWRAPLGDLEALVPGTSAVGRQGGAGAI